VQRIRLDRAGLTPGVYHLQLLAGETRATARLVVLP
jgi:hypothetical protein